MNDIYDRVLPAYNDKADPEPVENIEQLTVFEEWVLSLDNDPFQWVPCFVEMGD